MAQKMLTAANRKALPALYTNENLTDMGDAIAHVKFFNPTGSQSWFITEFDGTDRMFGYVTGMDYDEFGYVSLAELSAVRGRFGLPIERDVWFTPTPMRDIISGKVR
jgi:hypothetical protein